ncbi:MAG: enoyl-CoA hydratase/isomerase family protein [Proteobacteria bacterium]|nr:enoyl-CoA hydratase/isomerase family protein [Pseudomonadota bacterium]MBS0611037.1 enoyl-CoA hydratase/isomerase family protein [Pseudomonadota bacterium]
MSSTSGCASITADRLTELALESAYSSAVSPLNGPCCLLVDLSDGGAETSGLQPRLQQWLAAQAGPVIGVGGATVVRHELGAACDLVLDDDKGLGTLLDNITQAPFTAMTLVQVLRVTEKMPATQALTVESLAYSTLQSGADFRRWFAARPSEPQRPSTDDGPPLLIERRNSALKIRLNRPSIRNAMTIEMRDALVEALELSVIDDSIKHIEVSGLGACFCTGGALEEFGSASDPATAHAVRSLRLPAATLLCSAASTRFHVHGACIGSGIEFPAFAHHLSASPGSFFQLPEIRFGLIPGAGGCVSIPRRIGRQRTAYLALSARRINTSTALEWGLIDEMTPAAAR